MKRAWLVMVLAVGCGGSHAATKAPPPTPVVVTPTPPAVTPPAPTAPAPTPPAPTPPAPPAEVVSGPRQPTLFITAQSEDGVWPLACVDAKSGQVVGGDGCMAPIAGSDEVHFLDGDRVVKATGKDTMTVCAIEGEKADTTLMLKLAGAPEHGLAVWPKDADLGVKLPAALAGKPAKGVVKLLQAAMKKAHADLKTKLELGQTLQDDIDGDGKPDLIYTVSAEQQNGDDVPTGYAGIFVVLAAKPKQVVAVVTSAMRGEQLSVLGTADVAKHGKRQLVTHESWAGGYATSIFSIESGAGKLVQGFGCDS